MQQPHAKPSVRPVDAARDAKAAGGDIAANGDTLHSERESVEADLDKLDRREKAGETSQGNSAATA